MSGTTKRPTGYSWRILAHADDGRGREIELYSPECAAKSNALRASVTSCSLPPVPPDRIAPNSKFDELVISPWFHLEEMDDNQYWMSVGDYHLDVSIDADGKATVNIRWEGDGPAPEQSDVFRDNTGI